MLSGVLRAKAKQLYRAIPGKRQLFEIFRRGPNMPHGLYQHLHFEGPFEVRIDATHRFHIQSYGTYVENELFWRGFGGSWESVSLRVWGALCRTRAGLAIDVGANTGVYALAAGALSRDVVAFEPVERMADRLRHNVSLNPFSIDVIQQAVSDRAGRLPIYDLMTEHNYSASLEGQGDQAVSYEVDVCTLDDFLAAKQWPQIAAVKIDVERHEPAVLRGMRRLLADQRPPILVEILDLAIGAEVARLLDGLGYRIFHIDERKGLISTDELGPVGDHNWNHLICTDDQFQAAQLQDLSAN